ncbi:hypothetical protein [Microbacterium candidum]|uniref:Uncharacterized protein n=1 Tax=Microbacterium candidum TaxID=3041922 RepID=A0ABT7MTV7_9MICO|nr:hypothetical protein [Microbacterium sp. ASV49]MDL9977886.1 hypothetical protein [Microbacterium sp. ASV49]
MTYAPAVVLPHRPSSSDELGQDYVINGTSHAHDLSAADYSYVGSGSDVFTVHYADGGLAGQVKIWSTGSYDATTGISTQSYSDKGTCSGFNWP